MKSRKRQGVGTSNPTNGAVGKLSTSRSKENKMSKYKVNQSSLSAINERDEYTTLQDVLNDRSNYLKQEELWAVCRECCLTLKRMSDFAEIIQSLCVMLETLAFDSTGHVYFTDHEIESDSHYIPPEYEEIGNSCKGHIYSLGMLIYEASAYNSTKIPEHSTRLRKLLNSMMDSDYGERVGLDAVIRECDQYFLSAGVGSSHDICKHLISSVNGAGVNDIKHSEDVEFEGIEMNVDGDSPVDLSVSDECSSSALSSSQDTSSSTLGSSQDTSSSTLGSSHDNSSSTLSSYKSKGSHLQPNNPMTSSMNLEELVEKYTPRRLQIIITKYSQPAHNTLSSPIVSSTKHAADDCGGSAAVLEAGSTSSSSILSPPSEFGSKCSKDTMKATNGNVKKQSSAFSHQDRRSDDEEESEDRGVGEGATLRAGQAPLKLPEAYRSPATHFTPIVLSKHDGIASSRVPTANTSNTASKTDRTIKELKKQLLKKHGTSDAPSKVSPRQPLSPPGNASRPSQHSSASSKTTDVESVSPRSKASGKPIASSRPSLTDNKSRKPSSIPVTQAVRPLPRQSVSKSNEIASTTDSPTSVQSQVPTGVVTVDTPASVPLIPTSAPASGQYTAQSVDISTPTLPAASSNSQAMVVNGATISSSPLISSYPTVPVMIQRDATTGAVSWLPVMTNMPYWTPLTPQQAPAVNMLPAINTPPATQIQSNTASSTDFSNTQNSSANPHPVDTNPVISEPQDSVSSSSTVNSSGSNIVRASNYGVSSTSTVTQNSEPTANTVPKTVETSYSTSAPPTITTAHTITTASTVTNTATVTRTGGQPVSNQRVELLKPNSNVAENSTNQKSGRERKQHSNSKGSKSKDSARKRSSEQLLTLTKIRQLLKNEFAYDGYMTHGQEDLEMAEFIGSLQLPALGFTNWCDIIVAKYGDLYWSEELLVSLYEVIHGHKPDIDRSPSGALRAKSARVLSVDEPGGATTTQSVSQRFATSPFRPIPLSESGLVVSSSASSTPRKAKRSIVKPKAMLPQFQQNEGGVVDVSLPQKAASPLTHSLSRLKSVSVSDSSPHCITEDLSRQHHLPSAGLTKSRSQNNMLQGSRAESRDLTPLVKSLILPDGGTRQVMYIKGKQANHMLDDIWTTSPSSAASAFEQESDSHSHSSASELRVKGRLLTYSMNNSLAGDELIDSAFGSKISSEYESDNSMVTHASHSSNTKAICSTLVYASHMADNRETISVLADKTARSVFISGYENKSVDGVKKKIADLNQQIAVNCKRRNKACKYVKKIHDSSQGKGSGDYKAMLTQIQVDYRDAVTELDYLCHAKLQLEVLLAEQASIEVACLFSFTKPSRPLLVIETKENPRLQFQTKIDSRTNTEVEALYAGEPYGLLSYLYAKGALEDGYILDFFHSYRYLLSAKDIMAFITEKYNAAKELKPCPIREKVMKRSLDLLTFWVTSYYSADFILSPTVVDTLVNFLQDEVLSEHQTECEPLLRLLDEYENDKGKNSVFVNPLPVNESLPYLDDELNPLSKKFPITLLVTGDKPLALISPFLHAMEMMLYKYLGTLRRSNTFLRRTEMDDWVEESKWNSSRSILTVGTGKHSVQYQRIGYSIASFVSSKAKKGGKETITPSSSFSADSFSITDYSPGEIAEQLTLIDQALFQDVHPVNFMNTLAQGIGASMAGSSADTIPNQEKKLLFHSGYVQLVGVPDMIHHSKKLAHWVTAEVINASNTKAQTAVVCKYLQIAKICKDLRNYASCMSIKDGLDHPLIRFIPAWKEVPTKLIQELEDTKLLLKTDPDSIKAPEDLVGLPTIPCALLFSLHVQQLEQGGFTLVNGMFRWPKLKSLARLVDLIRICKNSTYKFGENNLLKEFLQNRMSEMYTHSLETLVLTSSADVSRGGGNGGSSSRWSNVLKKVKGKFA